MQFGDSELDPFVKNVVKPAVKEDIGYDLVDMRDVAQAGVIDNILRTWIRDAAFLIVDLTRDNPGAYWEAGYAEGLGKPLSSTSVRERSSRMREPTSIPIIARRFSGPGMTLIATLRRSLD